MKETELNRIVFFDGVCNICNRSVNFLLKIDRNGILKYASLQGETAKNILKQDQLTDLATMYYYKDGSLYQKSNGVLEIMWDIGGFWKALYFFKIIPVFVREFIYNFIARNRYKWFGKKETCRVPAPEEREQFLP